MEFTFFQPPGSASASGGGAYINGLIAALRAAGHDAVVETGTALPTGRIAVIDGLGLTAFPPDALADAVGVIYGVHALAAQAQRDRLPRLRRVIATNNAAAERLAGDVGVSPERITMIPPGVPDVPRSAGSGGPHCAILSVGALVPRKGHAVLLSALARLQDLDWRLTIVGNDERDPAHAAALREQAETSGIAGRVRFAGELPDAALETAWRGAGSLCPGDGMGTLRHLRRRGAAAGPAGRGDGRRGGGGCGLARDRRGVPSRRR